MKLMIKHNNIINIIKQSFIQKFNLDIVLRGGTLLLSWSESYR